MIISRKKFEYDDQDRPIGITVEEGGKVIHKTILYDDLGRPSVIFEDGGTTTRITQTIKMDGKGRVSEIVEEEVKEVGSVALPRGGFF